MARAFNLKNGTILLSTEAPGGLYNAAQLKAIASLCDDDVAIVKATEDQRIALFVKEGEAEKVAAELKGIGLGIRNYQDGLHQPVTCVGELCPDHEQDALGSAMELTKALAAIELSTPLKIGLNGCGRCCVPCHTFDISIVADGYGYRISLGGKNSQIPEMASFIAEQVPGNKLVDLVTQVVSLYKEKLNEDEEESLQDVIDRCGSSDFIKALAPYSQDAADDGDPFGSTIDDSSSELEVEEPVDVEDDLGNLEESSDDFGEPEDLETSEDLEVSHEMESSGDLEMSNDLESSDDLETSDDLESSDELEVADDLDDADGLEVSDDLEPLDDLETSEDLKVSGEEQSEEAGGSEDLDDADEFEDSDDLEELEETGISMESDEDKDELSASSVDGGGELEDEVPLDAEDSSPIEDVPINDSLDAEPDEVPIDSGSLDAVEDEVVAIESDEESQDEAIEEHTEVDGEPENQEVVLEESDDLEDLEELEMSGDLETEENFDSSEEDAFEQKINEGIQDDLKWRSQEEIDDNAGDRSRAMDMMEAEPESMAEGVNNEVDDVEDLEDLEDLDDVEDLEELEELDEAEFDSVADDLEEIVDEPGGEAEVDDVADSLDSLPDETISERKESIEADLSASHLPSNSSPGIHIEGVSLADDGSVHLNFSGGAYVSVPTSGLSPQNINFAGNVIEVKDAGEGVEVVVGAFQFFLPKNSNVA